MVKRQGSLYVKIILTRPLNIVLKLSCSYTVMQQLRFKTTIITTLLRLLIVFCTKLSVLKAFLNSTGPRTSRQINIPLSKLLAINVCMLHCFLIVCMNNDEYSFSNLMGGWLWFPHSSRHFP